MVLNKEGMLQYSRQSVQSFGNQKEYISIQILSCIIEPTILELSFGNYQTISKKLFKKQGT